MNLWIFLFLTNVTLKLIWISNKCFMLELFIPIIKWVQKGILMVASKFRDYKHIYLFLVFERHEYMLLEFCFMQQIL